MTGVKAIAEALNVNSSMTSVNLANNNLSELHYDSTLRRNVTDMTGVKAIADALSVSSSMTSLK